MPRMFGTDGVRGLANRALTAQLALDLGDAAVRVLGDDGDKSEFDGRRRALVGRDTRVSGDFLAAALSAGMSAGGFDVIDAGIIPTPGVAYLTSVLNVEMGAVISASHNPMPDNGIKFFARGGFKLPDTKEDEIENVLGQDWERPTGAGVGRISHDTATLPSISQVSAYTYETSEQLEKVCQNRAAGFAYTRIGNPTVAAFERRICEMEGGFYCYAYCFIRDGE